MHWFQCSSFVRILAATATFSLKLNPSVSLPTPVLPSAQFDVNNFSYSMSTFQIQIWPESIFLFLHVNRKWNSKMDLQSWIPSFLKDPSVETHHVSVCGIPADWGCQEILGNNPQGHAEETGKKSGVEGHPPHRLNSWFCDVSFLIFQVSTLRYWISS